MRHATDTAHTGGAEASGLDNRLRLWVRREPQRPRGLGRIEPEFLPPAGFVPVAMKLTMMSPAERDRKLVTELFGRARGSAQSADDGHRRAGARRPSTSAEPQSAHARDRVRGAAQDAKGPTCRPKVMLWLTLPSLYVRPSCRSLVWHFSIAGQPRRGGSQSRTA